MLHVRMLLPNKTQPESFSMQLAAGIMLQPQETRMNQVLTEEQVLLCGKTGPSIYKTRALQKLI